MKKIAILLLSMTIAILTIAQTQSPAVSWNETSHLFGKFKEEAGKQTAVFECTNTGGSPLRITNVRASCGCTATDYTRDSIAPGRKGYVKVTYNPRNRPGKFNKSVTVTTNTDNPTTILRIQGEVTPRVKGIEDIYPKLIGDLRMRSSHIAFNTVTNKQVKTDTMSIINMGDKPATITFENVPKHLSISISPATLAAKKPDEKHGGKGLVTVKYDGSKKGDWGHQIDRVSFVVNGEQNRNNRLSISASIEEDFSHLTPEELKNAPSIKFNTTEFNFGSLTQGESASTDFEFRNEGKSDLIIRKIKSTCGCTTTNPEKMVIKSGESSKLGVRFNSSGKRGRQMKNITVITNDPKNQQVVLRIVGDVVTKDNKKEIEQKAKIEREELLKKLGEQYPNHLPSVYMTKSEVAFPEVYKKQVVTQTIEVINIVDNDVEISFDSVPKYISIAGVKLPKADLKSQGSKGAIVVAFDAAAKKKVGSTSDVIYVKINGKDEGKIVVNANLLKGKPKKTK